ncbi:MAG: hypothetical protein MI919_27140 [Holophagales bacterium]|nr:hypothetical protein [Holophagales bacterium]
MLGNRTLFRSFLLLLLATPLAAQAPPPSVNWWQAGVYPTDSPVWWTLDPNLSSDELRAAWQSLDAHRLRYQDHVIAAEGRYEWAGDEVAFYLDGGETPELIPLWLAWDEYAREVGDDSGLGFHTAQTEVDRLAAAGLGRPGAHLVLDTVDLYSTGRDQLADQLRQSNQLLLAHLENARQVMGPSVLEQALATDDVTTIASALDLDDAVHEG